MREWFFTEGIRVDAADGRPIGVTRIYIDPLITDISENADFGDGPIYLWLQEHAGVRLATLSQDISAVALTPIEAEVFGEQSGAPALRMVRRYFDDQKRIFQIAVTIHRSNDFVYNILVHQP
jgi:DNA-binding GntR family transcriptional regulator